MESVVSPDLHSKTAFQNSPKQLKEMRTCFKYKIKKKKKKKQWKKT